MSHGKQYRGRGRYPDIDHLTTNADQAADNAVKHGGARGSGISAHDYRAIPAECAKLSGESGNDERSKGITGDTSYSAHTYHQM